MSCPPQQTFVTASASLPEKSAAFPGPCNLRTSCLNQAEATDVTSLGEDYKKPSPPSAVPATLTWLTGLVERSSPRHESRERLDNSTKAIHGFTIPECHRGICQGMWQRLAHLQYIQSHSAWKRMKGQRGMEWRGETERRDEMYTTPFTLPSPSPTQHWKINSLLSRIRVTAITKHLPQARCFIPTILVFIGVVLPSRQLCLHFPKGNRIRNVK